MDQFVQKILAKPYKPSQTPINILLTPFLIAKGLFENKSPRRNGIKFRPVGHLQSRYVILQDLQKNSLDASRLAKTPMFRIEKEKHSLNTFNLKTKNQHT